MTDKEYLIYLQNVAIVFLGGCGLTRPKWEGNLKRLNGAVAKGGGRFFLQTTLSETNNPIPWVSINSEAARVPVTLDAIVGKSHRPNMFFVDSTTFLPDLMVEVKSNLSYISGHEDCQVPSYLSMSKALVTIRDFIAHLVVNGVRGFTVESAITRIARGNFQLILNIKADKGHYQLISFEFDGSQ